MRTHPDRWRALLYVATANFGFFMVLDWLGVLVANGLMVAAGLTGIGAAVMDVAYVQGAASGTTKEVGGGVLRKLIQWGRLSCEVALGIFLGVAVAEYLRDESAIAFFARLPEGMLLGHAYVWLGLAITGAIGFLSIGWRMYSSIEFPDGNTRKEADRHGVR